MAKKSKPRKERIDPVAPRNAFRVAQAKRDVAEALPGIIRLPKKAITLDKSERRKPITDPGDYRDRPAPDKSPGQDLTKTPKRPQRSLGVSNPEAERRDERLKGCKLKPQKTTGSGNSRPFVPWCKK